MSKSKGSPRKFAEKIALLNKKEAEATAEFEKILKEVEETTRTPIPGPPIQNHQYNQQQQQKEYWGLPARSSSFSNWQTCNQSHQSQIQHQNNSRYLIEPNGFNNVIQQSRLRHQQEQQQAIGPTRSRPTIYVNQQGHPQGQYRLPGQQPSQHVVQLRPINQTLNQTYQAPDGHIQARPSGVPNIEIFPIDDERSYQQQQAAAASENTFDCLTNGHLLNDNSNSSMSSARSLPNIAELSVSTPSSGTSKCHLMQQTLTNQRLLPQSPETDGNCTQDDDITQNITRSNHSTDSYAHSSTNDYYNDDEYCSLPAIHEPVLGNNHHNQVREQQVRQSLAHDSQNDSWQHVVTSSAPCSETPTPPRGTAQSDDYSMNFNPQPIGSPNSSPNREHSPQNLQQNYYSVPVQSQNQIIRANSTNTINNNDLLVAPSINNNLSKSSEAYYGYLDHYATSDSYRDPEASVCDSFSNTGSDTASISTPMRGCSGNESNNIPAQNDFKPATQCIDSDSQQYPETPQYQFYL